MLAQLAIQYRVTSPNSSCLIAAPWSGLTTFYIHGLGYCHSSKSLGSKQYVRTFRSLDKFSVTKESQFLLRGLLCRELGSHVV
jgi:hypothetical protein